MTFALKSEAKQTYNSGHQPANRLTNPAFSLEKVEDLRRLAKYLLLEVFEKLPRKTKLGSNTNGNTRKRTMQDEHDEIDEAVEEPARKRGRKSLAPSTLRTNVAAPTRGRRSMLPSIPTRQVRPLNIFDQRALAKRS